MPSPFPGMDPYLEQPIFWAEFHNRLIVALADALAPSLLPRYYVGVESRPRADLYGFTLREKLPTFPLPLKELSEQVMVDLQAIAQGIYDRDGYSIRINYQQSVLLPEMIH